MKHRSETLPIDDMKVRHYDGSAAHSLTDRIIRELPVDIFINGNKTITIACAGIHLEELAAGFLRSEGIIETSGDIEHIKMTDNMDAVHLSIRGHRGTSLERSIFSSGARETISGTPRKALTTTTRITASHARELMANHLASTTLHSMTHGTHCSSLFDADGTIIISREDIGRHNTFDMIGGYALLEKMDCSDRIIATTGRVSSEILFKVWKLGIPIILSHAVPTSRAITTAETAGITIIGYMRNQTMRVYSHEERVIFL
jgi:FdhD protein